jgi:hypothetical protein
MMPIAAAATAPTAALNVVDRRKLGCSAISYVWYVSRSTSAVTRYPLSSEWRYMTTGALSSSGTIARYCLPFPFPFGASTGLPGTWPMDAMARATDSACGRARLCRASIAAGVMRTFDGPPSVGTVAVTLPGYVAAPG